MFKRWNDYQTFATAVKYSRRYVRTPDADAFLEAVRSSAVKRVTTMKAGTGVWRAQRGSVEHVSDKYGTVELIAHPPERMMPRERIGREGRVNSKGMPCFYGATTRETAMSEVRPWAGEDVSLAGNGANNLSIGKSFFNERSHGGRARTQFIVRKLGDAIQKRRWQSHNNLRRVAASVIKIRSAHC